MCNNVLYISLGQSRGCWSASFLRESRATARVQYLARKIKEVYFRVNYIKVTAILVGLFTFVKISRYST